MDFTGLLGGGCCSVCGRRENARIPRQTVRMIYSADYYHLDWYLLLFHNCVLGLQGFVEDGPPNLTLRLKTSQDQHIPLSVPTSDV